MNIIYAEYVDSNKEIIDVEIVTEEYSGRYTYMPDDDAPTALLIKGWLADNPNFPITPYEEPEPVNPLSIPLPRVAFLAMLDLMSDETGMDIEAAILTFIETQMPTTTPQERAARALAKRLFTEGQEFIGTNPLFSVIVPALGLTQQQFEEAWETAGTFTW